MRKYCSNSSCTQYTNKVNYSSIFCATCGQNLEESIEHEIKTSLGELPNSFISINNDRFQQFRHDNGNYIFLLPNLFSEQRKFGPITKEFIHGSITSITVPGYFAEGFDEFREYYAPFIKTLDDTKLNYSIDYGLVKYYY